MGRNLELRRFAGDASINLLRISLMTLAGIGISMILARGLGDTGKGYYELAVFLPMLLYTLLNIAIQQGTIFWVGSGRYSVRAAARGNITFTLWLSMLSTVVGWVLVVYAGAQLFPGVPLALLLLSLVMVPLLYLRFGLSAVFQGAQDFRSFSMIELIPYFVHLLLMLLALWWFSDRVMVALGSLIIANLLAVSFGFRRVRQYPLDESGPLFSRQLSPDYRRDLTAYGLKTQMGLIMLFLLFRVDLFLLNQVGGGAASVGLYSVAVQLAERVWVFTGFAGQVMMPRIAAWTGEDEKRTELTLLTMRFTFWLSVLLLGLVLLLGDGLIRLLFGEAFSASTVPLILIMPGIVMYNFSRILGADMSARGKPEINSFLFAIALAINILANLLLIPALDYAGAALASAISYTVLGGLTLAVFARINTVSWWRAIVLTREDWRLMMQGGRWLRQRLRIRPASDHTQE